MPMQLLTSEVNADYYTHPPWNCKSFNAYNYIQAVALHIHTQGRFKNHTAHSLYRIMVTATGVMGVMKVGNIVPRVGLKPTSPAFWVSVLPLHHSLPDVTHTMPSLYSSLPQRSVQTNTTVVMYK